MRQVSVQVAQINETAINAHIFLRQKCAEVTRRGGKGKSAGKSMRQVRCDSGGYRLAWPQPVKRGKGGEGKGVEGMK
jgi:hypothetical protein